MSRYIVEAMYLENPQWFTIWNGGTKQPTNNLDYCLRIGSISKQQALGRQLDNKNIFPRIQVFGSRSYVALYHSYGVLGDPNRTEEG